TLRGKVLEIGGVKEKVLAAYRAGIREVILPRGNDRDLRDVPDEVRECIKFEYVDRMDDVIRLALLPAPEPPEVEEERKPERKRKREAAAATKSDSTTAESED